MAKLALALSFLLVAVMVSLRVQVAPVEASRNPEFGSDSNNDSPGSEKESKPQVKYLFDPRVFPDSKQDQKNGHGDPDPEESALKNADDSSTEDATDSEEESPGAHIALDMDCCDNQTGRKNETGRDLKLDVRFGRTSRKKEGSANKTLVNLLTVATILLDGCLIVIMVVSTTGLTKKKKKMVAVLVVSTKNLKKKLMEAEKRKMDNPV